MEECLYCHSEIEESEAIPAIDDDDTWSALAQDHADDCKWIRTRALCLRIEDAD